MQSPEGAYRGSTRPRYRADAASTLFDQIADSSPSTNRVLVVRLERLRPRALSYRTLW